MAGTGNPQDPMHGQVEQSFTLSTMTDEASDVFDALLDDFRFLAHNVVDALPPSRERSLVITKLEEASFFVAQALAQPVIKTEETDA